MNPPLNRCDPTDILGGMSTDTTSAKDMQCALLTGLIQRVAAGDEAALGHLYDLTLPHVYALAQKITGRRDLAEEVCVETYWQSWREADRYDAARGHPLAWLMVMARSRALDALRRLDRVAYCPDPEALLESAACPQGSPLDHLLLSEQSGTLTRALAVLTPIQRQIVALAFYKDLTHQEISDQTRLPLGTVKSHLKRAQDSLRGILCQA